MRFRLLWGVLAVATGIAGTSWAGGVPVLPVSAYWAAWAWGVVAPGILVHRAIRGRPSTIVGDLALGAAVGMVLQLVAWAVMTALGLQQYLLWWPMLVVLAFVAVPRLRAHFSLQPYERQVPTGAAALTVTGFVIALYGVLVSFRSAALPPKALVWYQDDLWNLGNVAELMRTMAPQVAQVAGRPFDYHWLSDAHLAAMSLTTSIDTVTLVGRLWAPPVLLVTVGVTMAVGKRVSGSAWVGAAAAFCFAVAPSIEVSSWFSPAGAAAVEVRSPSQTFAVPFALLAIDLLVSLVRRRQPLGTWLLLAATLVACAGAKSSVLPVLFGGLTLAAFVALLVARHRLGATLATVVLTLAVVLVTQFRLAGGQNGSTLEPLATLKAAAPWRLAQDGTAAAGGLIAGFSSTGTGRLLALLLAGYLVSYVWVLAGANVLRRTDLAGWFLFGTGLAGLLALLAIRHPAYSQIYFLRIGIVAWQLLALWGYHRALATARDRVGGAATVRWAIAGGAIGVAVLAGARFVGGPAPSVPPVAAVTSSLERSLLVAAVGVVLASAALIVANRWMSRASQAIVVAMLASGAMAAALAVPARAVASSFGLGSRVAPALLVALVAIALLTTVRWSRRRADIVAGAGGALIAFGCVAAVVAQSVVWGTVAIVSPVGPNLVTVDEVAAARWLGQHTQQYDVVATNVHCLPVRTAPYCDARAFWVSGLSGRRVLVEGWGYTDAAQAANGRGGRSFAHQPFDDPALLALNDGVFTRPTAEGVAQLYAHGVRWLLADRSAGPVSPTLAQLATTQFRSGPVTVYRLAAPRPAVTTR